MRFFSDFFLTIFFFFLCLALAASQWRVMGPREREPYMVAAEKERAETEGQFRAWKAANPDAPTGYNKEEKVAVDLPKRSAYMIFLESLREFEGEGVTEKALVKRSAECWEKFSAEERRPFQVESKRERAEYKEAFEMLNPNRKKKARKPNNRKAKTEETTVVKMEPLMKTEPVWTIPGEEEELGQQPMDVASFLDIGVLMDAIDTNKSLLSDEDSPLLLE